MAKKLTKGKRAFLIQRVGLLLEWVCPYWERANYASSIELARYVSAQRAALYLKRST
jgi:hypothetical protein